MCFGILVNMVFFLNIGKCVKITAFGNCTYATDADRLKKCKTIPLNKSEQLLLMTDSLVPLFC